MEEQHILKHWNQMRTQIIHAQIAPAIVLIGIFVTAAFGKFETASDATKYLTIGVAAVTGILAIITQYAAIREGEALIIDLRKIKDSSALSQKIASSRGLVSLSAITIANLGVATFALVTWAVLV